MGQFEMVGFSRCYTLAGFGQIVFLWPDLYVWGLDNALKQAVRIILAAALVYLSAF